MKIATFALAGLSALVDASGTFKISSDTLLLQSRIQEQLQPNIPWTWQGLGVEDCIQTKYTAENFPNRRPLTCGECAVVREDTVGLQCDVPVSFCNDDESVCVSYSLTFEWPQERGSSAPDQLHNITYLTGPLNGQSFIIDSIINNDKSSDDTNSCSAKVDLNDGSDAKMCSSCESTQCSTSSGPGISINLGIVDCDNGENKVNLCEAEPSSVGSTESVQLGWAIVRQEYERLWALLDGATVPGRCEITARSLSVLQKEVCTCNLTDIAVEPAQAQAGNTTEAGQATCQSNKCIYCDPRGNFCATKMDGRLLTTNSIIRFKEFNYVSGREDVVRVEFGGSDTCVAFVNGDLCQSCEGGFSGVPPVSVDCTNVVAGEKYTAVGIPGGEEPPAVPKLFAVFDNDDSSYTECFDRRLDSLYGCEREAGSNGKCSCNEIPGVGHELICSTCDVDTCSEFEPKNCAVFTEGATFSNYAQVHSRFHRFDYTVGLSDSVNIERPEHYDVCNATINGQRCNLCFNGGCGTAFVNEIDCSNVLGADAKLSSCKNNIYSGGIFDFLLPDVTRCGSDPSSSDSSALSAWNVLGFLSLAMSAWQMI